MPEVSRHVHIVDQVPELEGVAPVLVVALDGFLDAGNAAHLAVEHLLAAQEDGHQGRVVASLDIDAFFDYRARRPPMRFVEDHYESYLPPRLVVRVQTDQNGASYLLLHGPEPDTHWEAFAGAVRSIVEHFAVRLVVALGSVPMAVPHTRPVMATNHATRADLLIGPNIWRGVIQIPASALALLELRLGEWGHDAMGFVAHVPHYVSQVDFPAGAVKLLECLEVVTGLQWALEDLQSAADTRTAEISQQVDESSEVKEVVAGLEQQYDALSRPPDEPLPLAEERQLPTAEELGEEFERFLAGLDKDDD